MTKTKHIVGYSGTFQNDLNSSLEWLKDQGHEIIDIKYSSMYISYNDNSYYSALIIYKVNQ
jgi:hypothetical protein